MFTLKFIKSFGSERQETCVHAPHYEAYRNGSGAWTISVYPTLSRKPVGVDRRISSADYQSCFVENEDGKTICKYTFADD